MENSKLRKKRTLPSARTRNNFPTNTPYPSLPSPLVATAIKGKNLRLLHLLMQCELKEG